MAGRLVADYGVGSEDDEPVDQPVPKAGSGRSSSNNSGSDHRKKPSDADKIKSSSRSTNVREVEQSSRRRSRSRSGSKDRKDRHHRHRSSKSKKDRHKRKSRSRSRSRSRDRRRRTRSRSRSRDRRRRNYTDDRKKRRSRSRSRSTRSRSRSSERRDKKSTVKAESNVSNNAPSTQKEGLLPTPLLPASQQVEAAATQAAVLAAQKLLQTQLDQAKQQATALPTFYNPAAVNTSKITEQMQKRKLLWANKEKKDTPTTSKIWEATAFNQDQDGKMTAKFKRLMGIKNEAEAAGESSSATGDSAVPDVLKKQQELFATLDQQYEVARAATHTQRGLGLGFSSSGFHFPR